MEADGDSQMVGSQDVLEVLNGIGVVELLENDQRITFIPNLEDALYFDTACLKRVYRNGYLRCHPTRNMHGLWHYSELHIGY